MNTRHGNLQSRLLAVFSLFVKLIIKMSKLEDNSLSYYGLLYIQAIIIQQLQIKQNIIGKFDYILE